MLQIVSAIFAGLILAGMALVSRRPKKEVELTKVKI